MIDEDKLCPLCGELVDVEEERCPNCGATLAMTTNSSKKGKGASVARTIGLLIRNIIIIAIGSTIVMSLIWNAISDTKANQKYGIAIYGTSTNLSSSSVDKSAVSKDLMTFLDKYEKFMDDYCDYMKKAQSGKFDMNQYNKLLNDLAEYESALSKLDTTKMNSTDYAYYVEVITRVNTKVANSMS